ncbi:hypothetical protein RA20_00655 [Leisingera sp. ANG-Vp]|nr:hypothetical protein RA20_00655 [Leisingera sp. ANG-Vp]
MVQAAAKGRDLMGGTDTMRSKGENYLPKFQSESDEAYKAHKNSTFLFNGYKKTVRDMTGKVFDKPVELTEGAPEKLKTWCENADMQGRDLSTFAKDVFKKGYDAGISYIMVDAPLRDGKVTQVQAERQNLRPYLVHLTVEDVLGWKTAVIGNVSVLSQLRIMETVEKDDPDDEFKSVSWKQVRVLDRAADGVTVRLFQQNEKQEWVEAERYKSAAKEITVIPFYAERTGFFTGEPVLEDLADVNIAHWQSQSNQRNTLRSARVPILFAAGRDDEAPLVIRAGSATTSRNPNAKLEWVEHSGAAIESGRQDLKDLEFQMEALGLQLLIAPGAIGHRRGAGRGQGNQPAFHDGGQPERRPGAGHGLDGLLRRAWRASPCRSRASTTATPPGHSLRPSRPLLAPSLCRTGATGASRPVQTSSAPALFGCQVLHRLSLSSGVLKAKQTLAWATP